jgi:hypothetical protein
VPKAKPPIAPDQVLDGEISGASRSPPIWRPVKKAPVSVMPMTKIRKTPAQAPSKDVPRMAIAATTVVPNSSRPPARHTPTGCGAIRPVTQATAMTVIDPGTPQIG